MTNKDFLDIYNAINQNANIPERDEIHNICINMIQKHETVSKSFINFCAQFVYSFSNEVQYLDTDSILKYGNQQYKEIRDNRQMENKPLFLGIFMMHVNDLLVNKMK